MLAELTNLSSPVASPKGRAAGDGLQNSKENGHRAPPQKLTTLADASAELAQLRERVIQIVHEVALWAAPSAATAPSPERTTFQHEVGAVLLDSSRTKALIEKAQELTTQAACPTASTPTPPSPVSEPRTDSPPVTPKAVRALEKRDLTPSRRPMMSTAVTSTVRHVVRTPFASDPIPASDPTPAPVPAAASVRAPVSGRAPASVPPPVYGPAPVCGSAPVYGPTPSSVAAITAYNPTTALPLNWPPTEPCVVVFVEFKRQRVERFRAYAPIAPGVHVLVPGDRGCDCGLVVRCGIWDPALGALNPSTVRVLDDTPLDMSVLPDKFFDVIREASAKEVAQLEGEQASKERLALKKCWEIVQRRQLPMEVVDCEYQFDGTKITIFFDATATINFTEITREMFSIFNARIWLVNTNPAWYSSRAHKRASHAVPATQAA